MAEKYQYGEYDYDDGNKHTNGTGRGVTDSSTGRPGGYDDRDVFGHEEGHDVRQHSDLIADECLQRVTDQI